MLGFGVVSLIELLVSVGHKNSVSVKALKRWSWGADLLFLINSGSFHTEGAELVFIV